MKYITRKSSDLPAMASEPFLGSIISLLSFLLRLIFSFLGNRALVA